MSDSAKQSSKAQVIWTDYQRVLNKELSNTSFSKITLQCSSDCNGLFFKYQSYKVMVDYSNKKQVILRCDFGSKHWFKEESAVLQGNKLFDSSIVISCIKNSLVYLEEACRYLGEED